MSKPTLLSGTFKRGSSWIIGFTRKDSLGAPVDMTGLTTRAMFRAGSVNGDVKFTLDDDEGIVIDDPTTGVMSQQAKINFRNLAGVMTTYGEPA